MFSVSLLIDSHLPLNIFLKSVLTMSHFVLLQRNEQRIDQFTKNVSVHMFIICYYLSYITFIYIMYIYIYIYYITYNHIDIELSEDLFWIIGETQFDFSQQA